DVKTGLLMFTTRRAVMATKRANEWRTKEKLAQLASNTVTKFAPDLARDFLLDVRRFANAAIAENAKRFGDPVAEHAGDRQPPSAHPVTVSVPPSSGSVATD